MEGGRPGGGDSMHVEMRSCVVGATWPQVDKGKAGWWGRGEDEWGRGRQGEVKDQQTLLRDQNLRPNYLCLSPVSW